MMYYYVLLSPPILELRNADFRIQQRPYFYSHSKSRHLRNIDFQSRRHCNYQLYSAPLDVLDLPEHGVDNHHQSSSGRNGASHGLSLSPRDTLNPPQRNRPPTREKRFRLLLYCLNKERKIPLEGSVNLKRKLLTFSANWGPDDAVVTAAIRFPTFQTPPKSRSRVEIKLEVACRVLSPTGGMILRLIFNLSFLHGCSLSL